MASQPVRDHLLCLLYCDLREYFGNTESSCPTFHTNGVGIFDPLLPGNTTQEVAATLLLNNFVKKFEDEAAEEAPSRCLMAFLESNSECSLWKEPDNCATPYVNRGGRLIENPAYQGFKSNAARQGFEAIKMCLRDTFLRPTPDSLLSIPGFDGENPWSWENVMLLGNNGPGASLGASGTSWYDKFYQSPLTFANPVLLEAYEQSLGIDTLRRTAENQRAQQYGYLQVSGGVFGSVPKSYDVDRSIETQPALEMWAQKGIAAIMEHFLRSKYGLDLASQPDINRELARRGSESDDSVTIDLSEASNRISYRFISLCLEGCDVLGRISEARVKRTKLPWGSDIDLHMVSTMGNGFTFALETAVFLAVVEAVYHLRGEKFSRQPRLNLLSPSTFAECWVDARNESACTTRGDILRFMQGLKTSEINLKELTLPGWGVFGDDIIVPKRMSDDVLFYLDIIGARVNTAKSFLSGPFRESCGGDYFNGVNVRAVYCRTVKTPQDKISLINRLNVWTSTWGIPLRRVCQFLWKAVPEKLLVPLHEAADAGLWCPRELAPKFPASKAVKRELKNSQNSGLPYRYFKVRPFTVTFRRAQLVIYGPGLLLGMLKGEITSGRLRETDPISRRTKLEYVLSLTKRADSKARAYDVRWALSYDWDRVQGNSIDVAALVWAVSVNLQSL